VVPDKFLGDGVCTNADPSKDPSKWKSPDWECCTTELCFQGKECPADQVKVKDKSGKFGKGCKCKDAAKEISAYDGACIEKCPDKKMTRSAATNSCECPAGRVKSQPLGKVCGECSDPSMILGDDGTCKCAAPLVASEPNARFCGTKCPDPSTMVFSDEDGSGRCKCKTAGQTLSVGKLKCGKCEDPRMTLQDDGSCLCPKDTDPVPPGKPTKCLPKCQQPKFKREGELCVCDKAKGLEPTPNGMDCVKCATGFKTTDEGGCACKDEAQEDVEGKCVAKCTEPKVFRPPKSTACECPEEAPVFKDGKCARKCRADEVNNPETGECECKEGEETVAKAGDKGADKCLKKCGPEEVRNPEKQFECACPPEFPKKLGDVCVEDPCSSPRKIEGKRCVCPTDKPFSVFDAGSGKCKCPGKQVKSLDKLTCVDPCPSTLVLTDKGGCACKDPELQEQLELPSGPCVDKCKGANQVRSGTSCVCRDGFLTSPDGQKCLKCEGGTAPTALWDRCECPTGTVMNDQGVCMQTCVKPEEPDPTTKACKCLNGGTLMFNPPVCAEKCDKDDGREVNKATGKCECAKPRSEFDGTGCLCPKDTPTYHDKTKTCVKCDFPSTIDDAGACKAPPPPDKWRVWKKLPLSQAQYGDGGLMRIPNEFLVRRQPPPQLFPLDSPPPPAPIDTPPLPSDMAPWGTPPAQIAQPYGSAYGAPYTPSARQWIPSAAPPGYPNSYPAYPAPPALLEVTAVAGRTSRARRKPAQEARQG
jgi:hypothetical protein